MPGRRMMILIEGNIAAGKTTIGQEIAGSSSFEFIEEPVEMWRRFPLSRGKTFNLLKWFYSDTKRAAYTFQTAAFITRAKNWTEILQRTNHNQVLLERSVFCDYNVFAFNCFRSKNMSEAERNIYRQLWALTIGQGKIDRPDLIIYYRTPCETCVQRMPKRHRAEEKAVVENYLKKLEKLHDEWLIGRKDSTAPLLMLRDKEPLDEEIQANQITVPVLVLDGELQWKGAEIAKKIEEKLSA